MRWAQSCRRIVRDTVNSASRPLLHAVMTPAQTLRPSPPGQPLAERLEMGTVTSRRSPCAIPHYGSASVTLCSHLEWNHGRADPAGTASVDSQQQRTEGAGSPRKVHVPHAAMTIASRSGTNGMRQRAGTVGKTTSSRARIGTAFTGCSSSKVCVAGIREPRVASSRNGGFKRQEVLDIRRAALRPLPLGRLLVGNRFRGGIHVAVKFASASPSGCDKRASTDCKKRICKKIPRPAVYVAERGWT